MIRHKLLNSSPRRGPHEVYFVSKVATRCGTELDVVFTEHEIKRALDRARRVLAGVVYDGKSVKKR